NGDVVQLRQTSSSSYATAVSTTLTVGGVSDDFSVTTAEDSTPDSSPSFIVTNALPGDLVISDAFTVVGLGVPAPISFTPSVAADAGYSVDGGAFTQHSGTVINGQSIRFRVRAFAS